MIRRLLARLARRVDDNLAVIDDVPDSPYAATHGPLVFPHPTLAEALAYQLHLREQLIAHACAVAAENLDAEYAQLMETPDA